MPILRAAAVAASVLVVVLAVVGVRDDEAAPRPARTTPVVGQSVSEPVSEPASTPAAAPRPAETVAAIPRWRTDPVLPEGGMLVAYYGTAGSGGLGVLGETSPDRAHLRLARAAAPFQRPGRPVRLVYELIVTIADAHPGKDGDFSHDISRAAVRRYVDAARKNGALLLLDIQPGRSDFLKVAKRWGWALAEPHVGLALDPEWRMGPRQVPGRVIGKVRAAEVNRVSAWLAKAVVDRDLPEKLFVLHQFRSSMLPDVRRVVGRDGLQMVQHVDGFGTPRQKLATFRAVARPSQFAMGFKLFYDEDVRRMGARAVHGIRPEVRFVSFQ